jgi:hypothetical protein
MVEINHCKERLIFFFFFERPLYFIFLNRALNLSVVKFPKIAQKNEQGTITSFFKLTHSTSEFKLLHNNNTSTITQASSNSRDWSVDVKNQYPLEKI